MVYVFRALLVGLAVIGISQLPPVRRALGNDFWGRLGLRDNRLFGRSIDRDLRAAGRDVRHAAEQTLDTDFH